MFREEHRLRMSVKKAIRGIFRPKTEVTVGRGILHYREVKNLYS
jgi:hypothetical protein